MASLRNGQRNGTSLINWTSCVGSRPTKIPVATISSHHRSSLREEECNRDPKSSDFEIARGPSTPLRHHFRWFSHLFAKSCSTLKSHVFSSWAQINLRLFGLLVLLFFFFSIRVKSNRLFLNSLNSLNSKTREVGDGVDYETGIEIEIKKGKIGWTLRDDH